MNPKAYILHSGGIDSTTALYVAAKEFGTAKVVALSIDYGQRHKKEMEYSRALCNVLGCNHLILKGPQDLSSMLTAPDWPIPNISYGDIEGVSPTYVPFRNGQLLSIAAAFAHVDLKKDEEGILYFGAHAEDAQNWAYPDCTPEFTGAMANAIYIGTYHRVRLRVPFQFMMKHEIIERGLILRVPYLMTWSCYAGEELHCGVCPTCRARRDAFDKARTRDPTQYAAHP